MSELRHRTHGEVEEHFGPRTIAILPTGSTEPHGPHLPLDTDVLVATARARRTAELLEEAGVPALVLPALPYGVTRLAQDFAGGITLRPGSLWALVEDLVLSLQQDGIRQLLVANGHHEHEQTRVLRNLAVDLVERGPGRCQVLFPDPLADEAEEFPREVDCHGGRGETSLMLHVAPEAVRREVLAGLGPVELSLPAPEPGKNRALAELGAPGAYAGDPASASAEEGRALLEELAGRLVSACRAAWPDLFEG